MCGLIEECFSAVKGLEVFKPPSAITIFSHDFLMNGPI